MVLWTVAGSTEAQTKAASTQKFVLFYLEGPPATLTCSASGYFSETKMKEVTCAVLDIRMVDNLDINTGKVFVWCEVMNAKLFCLKC